MAWAGSSIPTPLQDSEFPTLLSPTRLAAQGGTAQASEMDLLTVVMNELGQAMKIDPALAPDLFSTPVAGVRDLPPGQTLAPALDTLFAQFGFHFQNSYFQDWLHHGEKWFQNSQNQWSFITPDGKVYQWGGSNFAGSTQVGTVNPLLYADPTKLFSPAAHLSPTEVQQMEQLQAAHGFVATASFWQNWLGQNEKWFLDRAGSWFFITPNGSIHQWGSAGNTLVATVNAAAWADPTPSS